MAQPDPDSGGLTDSASSILSPIQSPTRARRANRTKTFTRTVAFIASVVSALCAGSITTFSLYGHIFQERLRYTQLQVNGVAIGSSIAQYLPVPILGYICDRYGTKPLSAIAAAAFGLGYGLAAVIYKNGDVKNAVDDVVGDADESDWTYPLMIAAFFCVGVGTCSMYLTAVATCAKNFGKGRHRGLALATPIACFGLSGMWISQVGSRLFHEGPGGDVDVFRYFVALAVLLVLIGIMGMGTLRVVGEDDLIEEAIEELETSGLLEGGPRGGHGYGAVDGNEGNEELTDHDDDAKDKKNWVLNAETRAFLSDSTMWCFALGFLLMIGPGEAFINNMGTVIGTLYPPAAEGIAVVVPTSPATHVSIVAIASTAARLLTGTLTDLLGPAPQTQHVQVPGHPAPARRFSISRVAFLLASGVILSAGLASLASGLIQNHGERFWVVSSLVGTGYGAVFSLAPIIIAVIWGVENFATNWGIVAMFPALGASFWGVVYSAVYQAGAKSSQGGGSGGDIFCYGHQCYAGTFWAMTGTVWVACLSVLWAWRGRDGWVERGVVI